MKWPRTCEQLEITTPGWGGGNEARAREWLLNLIIKSLPSPERCKQLYIWVVRLGSGEESIYILSLVLLLYWNFVPVGERVFDFYLKETLIVQRLRHQVSLMRFLAALFWERRQGGWPVAAWCPLSFCSQGTASVQTKSSSVLPLVSSSFPMVETDTEPQQIRRPKVSS